MDVPVQSSERGPMDIMNTRAIADALKKYRTALSLTFYPKPGDEDQGMDSELQIPETLNSAQSSFGFDDELYDYRTQNDPGPLKLIRDDDFARFEEEEGGIEALCIEEPSSYQMTGDIHHDDNDNGNENEAVSPPET